MVYNLSLRKGKKRKLSLRKKIKGGALTYTGPVKPPARFFNSNIVQINTDTIPRQIIIGCGHCTEAKQTHRLIDTTIYEYTTDSKNFLQHNESNNGLFYFENDNMKDFSIFTSYSITRAKNTIIMGYTLNDVYDVKGIKRSLKIGDKLLKNGGNTRITSGIVSFEFIGKNKEILQQIQDLDQIDIKIDTNNFIRLQGGAMRKLTAIYDYYVKPDLDTFYKLKDDNHLYFNGNKISEEEFFLQLYKIVAPICNSITGGDESNKLNTDDLTNICNTYYKKKRIGWTSYQGDSGSGWYEIDTVNKTAALTGITIAGNIGATLERFDGKNDKKYSFDTDGYVCIGNYRIKDFFKGSFITSVNTLEQNIQDFLGKNTSLQDIFSSKPIECSITRREILREIAPEKFSQRELHMQYLSSNNIEKRKRMRSYVEENKERIKSYTSKYLDTGYSIPDGFPWMDTFIDEDTIKNIIVKIVIELIKKNKDKLILGDDELLTKKNDLIKTLKDHDNCLPPTILKEVNDITRTEIVKAEGVARLKSKSESDIFAAGTTAAKAYRDTFRNEFIDTVLENKTDENNILFVKCLSKYSKLDKIQDQVDSVIYKDDDLKKMFSNLQ